MDDPFNLERFVSAQANVFEQVLAELRVGAKRTHWIWFIFPQMRGLGRSPQSAHFGIGSLEEAVAYLRHPVLGPRLAAISHTDRFGEERWVLAAVESD